MANIYDKLERQRRPRVHIKYEVETGGAMVERELPFVVGVMGDFSGNPTTPLRPLKERKFVRIAEQVPALKKLLDTRNQLRDLMTKVDRSADLENILERVLQNETELKAL